MRPAAWREKLVNVIRLDPKMPHTFLGFDPEWDENPPAEKKKKNENLKKKGGKKVVKKIARPLRMLMVILLLQLQSTGPLTVKIGNQLHEEAKVEGAFPHRRKTP